MSNPVVFWNESTNKCISQVENILVSQTKSLSLHLPLVKNAVKTRPPAGASEPERRGLSPLSRLSSVVHTHIRESPNTFLIASHKHPGQALLLAPGNTLGTEQIQRQARESCLPVTPEMSVDSGQYSCKRPWGPTGHDSVTV